MNVFFITIIVTEGYTGLNYMLKGTALGIFQAHSADLWHNQVNMLPSVAIR